MRERIKRGKTNDRKGNANMIDNDMERKIVKASKSVHDHVCMNIFIQEERKKENSPSLLFNIFRVLSE